MNEQTQKLTSALSTLSVRVEEADYPAKGYHALLVVESGDQIADVARILLKHEYFMGFVTACHTEPAIQMIYQFARFDVNHRIMVRCSADENNSVPTISHIFQGADWHERETHDFFGVTFIGHPNLAPLILDESDRDFKPLLKNEKTLKSVETIFGEGNQKGDRK